MGRKKLDPLEKRSININWRLKVKDAGLLRAACKLEGDRDLSAFIYRTVMPRAEEIVAAAAKKVVNDETAVRE